MQASRNTQNTPSRQSPEGSSAVPSVHWNDLSGMDLDALCQRSLAVVNPAGALQLPFLASELQVDFEKRCIRILTGDSWVKIDHPRLELLTLLYLLNVSPAYPVKEMISVRDLKDSHFFQGPHELKTRPLLDLYGQDLRAFQSAAETLGGKVLKMADAAFELLPFPKVPLYYLLWEGDEEFEPNLSILLDRSIERHLAADAIWGLINLVSDFLITPEINLMAETKRSG
jgi:hypothetical protein